MTNTCVHFDAGRVVGSVSVGRLQVEHEADRWHPLATELTLCGDRLCGDRLCGDRLCGDRLCGDRRPANSSRHV